MGRAEAGRVSLDALRSQLRGYDGVAARVRELQAQIGTPQPSAEFSSTLNGVPAGGAPTPLQGTVGSESSEELKPMPVLQGQIGISANKAQLRAMADSAARSAGVDPKLFAALVQTESDWDPTCRSDAGAMGLCQLMPDTAKEMGIDRPFDPQQGLNGGARYLRSLLNRFGNETLAVAAYNAGPGRVRDAGGVPAIPETQAYVRKVMARRGG